MSLTHPQRAASAALARLVLFALCSLTAAIGYARPAQSTMVLRKAALIADHWIVVLREDGTDPEAFARSQGHMPSHVYRHAIKGYAVALPERAVAALRKHPRVQFVQQDSTVYGVAQTLPTGIDRIDADTNTLANIDGFDDQVDVDVAVIDSGIDGTHPDLNVVGGVNYTTVKQTQWTDANGHGTHCAGTIGARDNGVGVVGVAPGARLWAVRVLDRDGSGRTSWVIAGIDWVKANAATIEVANMSLGGLGADDGNCGNTNNDAEHKAICAAVAAGVTFIVAAGNESDDSANHVPAAYDEVITVSALADFDGKPGALGTGSYAFSSCTEAADDSFACFSNYGADVDIMAPGVGIYSTYKTGTYSNSSGTSMAAPHVAGAAALIAAANPTWGPAEIKAQLLSDAKPSTFVTDDPDGVHEPLLYVGAIVPTHDLAITGVSAVKLASPGDVLEVVVSVSNPGTFAETSTVTLSDLTSGQTLGVQSVSLGAGGATTVSFSWNTTGATFGAHVLGAEVAAVSGETATTNNSGSAIVDLVNPVHDVAVTSVTAPAQVVAGQTATVSVAVQNQGTFAETFSVSLNDGIASVGSQQVTLAAGASTTLSFSWSTAGLAAGGYTLTATADTVSGEGDAADNSAATTTSIVQSQALVVAVSTDKATYINGQTAAITVTVTDGVSAVSGAAVVLKITTPKGLVYTGNGTSDAAGKVTFSFGINAKKDGKGTLSLAATATKAGFSGGAGSGSFIVL